MLQKELKSLIELAFNRTVMLSRSDYDFYKGATQQEVRDGYKWLLSNVHHRSLVDLPYDFLMYTTAELMPIVLPYYLFGLFEDDLNEKMSITNHIYTLFHVLSGRASLSKDYWSHDFAHLSLFQLQAVRLCFEEIASVSNEYSESAMACLDWFWAKVPLPQSEQLIGVNS